MSEATSRFLLPFILPGQAQKELLHNEALSKIDLLLHAAVEAGPNNTPSVSPEEGQLWLVGDDPEGAWVSRESCIAMWTDGGWRFAQPSEGMSVWSKSEGYPLHWNGLAWGSATAAASIEIAGVQVLGPQRPSIPSPSGGSIIDAEARSAIAAVIATLMSHGLIE